MAIYLRGWPSFLEKSGLFLPKYPDNFPVGRVGCKDNIDADYTHRQGF